jgi:hypothetical protein
VLIGGFTVHCRLAENEPPKLLPLPANLTTPTILFHNVMALDSNYAYVAKNELVLAADVVILAETRVSAERSHLYHLDGFDYSYFTPQLHE